MTDEERDQAMLILNGRMIALEAMLIQTVWRWAESQPHAPLALVSWMRPLEEQLATLRNSPEIPPLTLEMALQTFQGVQGELEATLRRAALDRATPQNSGKA
jgi:hypothetical protein